MTLCPDNHSVCQVRCIISIRELEVVCELVYFSRMEEWEGKV